jgi:hypothetical protein
VRPPNMTLIPSIWKAIRQRLSLLPRRRKCPGRPQNECTLFLFITALAQILRFISIWTSYQSLLPISRCTGDSSLPRDPSGVGAAASQSDGRGVEHTRREDELNRPSTKPAIYSSITCRPPKEQTGKRGIRESQGRAKTQRNVRQRDTPSASLPRWRYCCTHGPNFNASETPCLLHFASRWVRSAASAFEWPQKFAAGCSNGNGGKA